MNKANAIRLYCLTCSGDSAKQVTLCSTILCELWDFRFGYSPTDKRFRQRMEAVKKNHPQEYKELAIIVRERLSEQPISPKNAQISTFFEED